ncbi:MAG: cytochrome c biogenesis protein CcsA, partial [Acidimicrobiales bacterium]|nr:cytochrome c biogenesis protein CcsA [Acidimicrobiales bacterium]
MSLGAALLGLSILAGIVASIRPRRELVVVHAGTAIAAVAVLVAAFATEDWSYSYVVSATRPGLGLLVRIAGLWGGAEGSLLLFVGFVAIAALIVEKMGGESRPLTALASAYAVVTLISANPFEQLDARAVGGLGLQPVLEHPAMAWHPPILYLGLVGVMIPGLLAVGGAGDRQIRAATRVSLAFLTAGLATGAAWAHAELGWGGYWAWDPIESA